MKAEEIYKKIDQCIKVLQEGDSISNFPAVIESLDYILNRYPEEIKLLSPGEHFEHSFETKQQTVLFFMEFVKKYIGYFYKTPIHISVDEELAMLGSGGHDKKTGNITISCIGMLLGWKGPTTPFHILFHEIKHKLQCDSFKAKSIEEFLKYPASSILLLKESIYEESHSDNNREFYKKNYDRLYNEIDAEFFGSITTKQMLLIMLEEYKKYAREHNIEVPQSLELKVYDMQKEMIEESEKRETKKKEEGKQQPDILDEIMGKKIIESTYSMNGVELDRLVELNQYIKKHPELQMEYPILKLIMDGERTKTYQEIMREKEIALQKHQGVIPDCIPITTYQKRIEELYETIIQTDPMLYLEDLAVTQRYDLLQDFLKKHETIPIVYQRELQELTERLNDPITERLIAQNRVQYR